MNQGGLFKQLAYYPRNDDGTIQSRPRVANYSHMEYCGGKSMKFECERLNTFKNWSKDFIKPSDLAKAGFFYACENSEFTDRVKCAFCRGVLHSWEFRDDPIKEHRRAFTTCPFVISMETGNIPIRSEGDISINCKISFENKKPFTLMQSKQTIYSAGVQRCDLNYISCKRRIRSFNRHYHLSEKYIQQLSRCGFYFTGKEDTVKCYKCHFITSLYNKQAIPDHEASIPSCPYLKVCKNPSDNTISYTRDPPSLSDSEFCIRKDSWACCKTKELGFDVDVINYVISYFKYFNGTHYLSLDLLIHHILNLKEKMSVWIHRDDLSYDCLLVWQTFLDQQRHMLRDNMEEKFKKLCLKVKNTPELITLFINEQTLDKCDNEVDYYRLINKSLQFNQNCKICFTNLMNTILIPCYHIVACQSCINQISICPICRFPIEDILPINNDF